MSQPGLTPEPSPNFVDDQEGSLPVPVFVTLESHRSTKAQIRQKIAAATACDRSSNAAGFRAEREPKA